MTDNIPWIEKYRPKKIGEISQTQNLLDLFKNAIETGDITHYLFYGPPGTGKTSAILAIGREIFKDQFSQRVIEFNASDDRGINAVRNKITNEAKKYVTEIINPDGSKIPPYKIIILDEADSMTDEAQDALRVIIEKYSNVTRFCFICNYISKITDAIKSRCASVYFKKLTDDCMINKLNDISCKESMVLDNEIYDAIIEISNGDMRKAIMLLQNIKYAYEYKKTYSTPLNLLDHQKLKYIYLYSNPIKNLEIKQSDVYHLAATISIEDAHKIINKIILCPNIYQITVLSKNVIAYGYPIDNIVLQLNKAILASNKFTDCQKSIIINYSGKIIYKMKECASEYIQLTDYMACIFNTHKNN